MKIKDMKAGMTDEQFDKGNSYDEDDGGLPVSAKKSVGHKKPAKSAASKIMTAIAKATVTQPGQGKLQPKAGKPGEPSSKKQKKDFKSSSKTRVPVGVSSSMAGKDYDDGAEDA